MRLRVPEHAALTGDGSDWRCRRGFRREGGSCAPFEVPDHASLDPTGRDWTCWRGYRKAGARCVRVEIPRYARLDETGQGWKCWVGYRQEQGRCIKLHRNAYAAALEAKRAGSQANARPETAGEGREALTAGLCGEIWVRGSVRIHGESLAVGRLRDESGTRVEFEGNFDPSGRVEGVDDQGRTCVLILAPSDPGRRPSPTSGPERSARDEPERSGP